MKKTKEQSFKVKSQRKLKRMQGITLVALVVTIVVLLILAGIALVYVLGDNSVFKQASEAKLKTDIANWQERLEMAKSPIFIEGLGAFEPDKYFDYIQQQGIINNKDTDVIDNGDGTYDVTVKPGYVFLVTLIPTPEKPTDAEIEYIGQVGKIAPIIKKIETRGAPTSISAKAIVARLGNGTVKYYYKSTSADDSTYQEITNVSQEIGATQNTGITAGESYTIKAVAKNDVGEAQLTKEITATEVLIESIAITPNPVTVKEGKTISLTVTILPANATNKWIRWSTSNTSVFSVSSNRLEITGKKSGTATLTVEATDGSNVKTTCTVTVTPPTVADIVGEIQTSNKTIDDENGNKIVVPGGFKVVPDTTTNDVDYTYNGDKKPCVQDGIVVEDNEGNQFVWIPVGSIKNKDNTTTTITLGRYEFDESNGTPTLKQNATNYASAVTIKDYFQEKTSNNGNTVAKSLSTFVGKTNSNGGYYLGRYEASKGSDGKVNIQTNKVPWVNITQPNAATTARGMYNSSYVDSDLINSYSWDTAIVFIQKYSENSNYANKASVNLKKVNTGKAGDKVCNIHDMASNCKEWTTEHSTHTSNGERHPWVLTGGIYNDNGITSPYRYKLVYFVPNNSDANYSFRPLLYLK